MGEAGKAAWEVTWARQGSLESQARNLGHTTVIIWVVKLFFVQFFCVFLPPLPLSRTRPRPPGHGPP